MAWYLDSKIAFSPEGVGPGLGERAADGDSHRVAYSTRVDIASSGDPARLPECSVRILAVLVKRAPARIRVRQLAALAGLRTAGRYFADGLRALRAHGLIAEARGSVWASELAVGARPALAAASTRDEGVALWQSKLPAPASAAVRILAEQGPLRVDEVARWANVDPGSGHWRQGLATLRANGLVEIHGGLMSLAGELR